MGNYFYADGETPFTINNIQSIIRGDVSMKLYRDICVRKGWDVEAAMEGHDKRDYCLGEYIKNHKGSVFVKSHSCFHFVEKRPYFSKVHTKGFISIVRDPRDVLCSYARHRGKSIEDTFESMCNDKFTLLAKNGKREYASSWDNHVQSFFGLQYPTMIIRYEDLLANPHNMLGSIAQNLKGTVDRAQLDFAIKHSSFDMLQAQEREEGFREASEAAENFFNAGQAGAWEDVLSKKQAKAVEKRFGSLMEKFGYL